MAERNEEEPYQTEDEEEESESEDEEEEEEEEYGDDESVDERTGFPAVMKQHDRRRMKLSSEHREQALRFKEAARALPELDPLPDLWYAQLAIVCGDDLQGGLDRLTKIQQYKEQYEIVDDLAFGKRCMREYLRTFPGYLMSCDFAQREGTYLMAIDMCAFDAKALRANPMAFIQGSYFLEQIGSFELESVRKGIIVLIECEGYRWTDHLGIDTLGEIWSDLWAVYPMNVLQLKHFNTGVFVNTMAAMTRKFQPRAMRQKIQFGCKFPSGRLDTVFNVPTLQEAQNRLLSRLDDCLEERYENEQTFSLDDCMLMQG